MRRLVVISISVFLGVIALYLWQHIPDIHQRAGYRDLPEGVATDQLSRITGMEALPNLTIVRSFGGADDKWFEFRVPPERLQELEAGMRKVAEVRGVSYFRSARGPGKESATPGMPNPEWFRASRLSEPTKRFHERLSGGPTYSMYFSESDGTILLQVP